jgi:hypothetical protein
MTTTKDPQTSSGTTPVLDYDVIISAEDMAQLKAGYPAMFQRCQETFSCFLHTPDPRGTPAITKSTTRITCS